jgi:hypothetical protein
VEFKKRLILLALYFILTIAVVWAFRHSPCGPIIFNLFVSWGWFLMSGFETGMGFFLAGYLINLFFFLFLSTKLSKRHKWKHPYLIMSIYGTGSILGILDKNSDLSNSLLDNMLGLLIGLPVVILYLKIDWRLAGSNRDDTGTNYLNLTK